MKNRATNQTTDTEWVSQLREELEKRTGRKDIEVTTTPYCLYDALVSRAADDHPIVNFYSAIQGDSQHVASALDFAVGMLQNWEVTKVLHDQMRRDCLPFYEKLKVEFPHLELVYNVVDFKRHYIRVDKVADRIVVAFDLWPNMTESDQKRLAFYIGDCEATLHREQATQVGVDYWQK